MVPWGVCAATKWRERHTDKSFIGSKQPQVDLDQQGNKQRET